MQEGSYTKKTVEVARLVSNKSSDSIKEKKLNQSWVVIYKVAQKFLSKVGEATCGTRIRGRK